MPSKEIQVGTTSQYSEVLAVYYGKYNESTDDTTWWDGIDDMDELFQREILPMPADINERKYNDLRVHISNNLDRTKVYSLNGIINEFENMTSSEITVPQLKDIFDRIDNSLIRMGYDKVNRDVQIANFDVGGEGSEDSTSSHKLEFSPPIRADEDIENMLRVKIVWMDTTEGAKPVFTTLNSTAKQLSDTVATWYVILRNIAIIVLMLILIYIGIRIVIGSTAGEKAKYKERLTDWLVAMCLIFIMHFIMVFAVELVGKITELVREFSGLNGNVAVISLTDTQYTEAQKIINSDEYDISKVGALDKDGPQTLTWRTDLAGLFRIKSQMTGEGTAKWAGYSMCYVVLVLFTLFFAWTYLRRVLYMAFLTMIAPLVAMTYPIDKITDGKAQAFDAWLKEYIFNLMIQPLHLLLYAILVSSAFELASTSPIYALVAIGFMTPAEKLMRRFFGFEKAKTPGLLGGAAGTALAMTGLQKMFGGSKSHGGKAGGNSGKTNDSNKLKFANRNSVNAMEAMAGGKPTGIRNVPEAKPTSGSTGARNVPKATHSGELTGKVNVPEVTNEGESIEEINVPETIDNNIESNNLGEDNNLQSEQSSNEQSEVNNGTSGTAQPTQVEDERQRQIRESTINANEAARQAQLEVEKQKRIKEFEAMSFDNVRAENIRRQRQKRLRGIKAGGAELGRQIGVKALEGVQGLGKTAAKIGGGVLGGAAAATVSMLEGDPNKMFQNTLLGYSLGSNAAQSLANTPSGIDTEAIQREAQIAAEGENYKKVVIEKEKKEFLQNASNINYLRQTMGVNKEEAQDILNTTGGNCFDKGITKVEDIATIHKLTTGSDAMTFDQALAARNYAKRRLPSNTDSLTQDSVDKYIERWKKEYEDAGYENAQALAERSFKNAIRYNKAESGLTKNP